MQWAHDVVGCNLLHTVDKVITDVSSTSLCLCTECCSCGIRDSCKNQPWNKKDKCANGYDASVIHHLWSFEEKNHGSNCMAGSTVSSTQSASLEDHKSEEQYISVRLMFCFQAPFEFWKSEKLDETDNHSWRQVEPVNRKACMNCRNSGPQMKWRSIPWKIPLQNSKINHWWFLWSDLSHPIWLRLFGESPVNPPWGTLGLSSKKVEHELLGSVAALCSAFFPSRVNFRPLRWASLAKFFPDSPHGLQRNIADFIHSTRKLKTLPNRSFEFIDFHWWSAKYRGAVFQSSTKTHRSHRVVHFGTLKIGANDSQFFPSTGNSLADHQSNRMIGTCHALMIVTSWKAKS